MVMTIPETQRSIRKLLEEHSHFGLKPEQFHFLNQYQVPAVLNMNGEIDFDAETATIHCKPHGHGECHLLMHKSGLARKFKEQGFEWITFFNDTNPLSFRFLPSYLGIASQHDWETTYVCVKRKPGEAVGAVCEVDLPDRTIITNVEYNVLEKLGKTKPEPIDAEGYSKLPGNVNFIIISLKTYADALERSSGFVPEFINPKFHADGHTLKSPTRMETLISEYTYLLQDSKRVGAIQCDRLMCFTSAKNEIELGLQRQAKNLSTETCGACQFEFYHHNRLLLEKVGVKVAAGHESQTLSGLRYDIGPRIVLRPTFACTFHELEQSVKSGVQISNKTFLDFNGKAVLENVSFDGSYRMENLARTPLSLTSKVYGNQKFVTFEDLEGKHEGATYDDKMRGFRTLHRTDIETLK